MAKGDWYKESDIDLFILGTLDTFEKTLYERQLNRTIELHLFKNKKEIEKVQSGLIKNVINGYVIKGNIQDVAEFARSI